MAKIWTKLGLVIVIIACLFNIVTKLMTRVTLSNELNDSANYIEELKKVNENVTNRE